ncbi:MAG TPA: hypothetical protein ACHBX0_12530 [Arsenophonus sp.]
MQSCRAPDKKYGMCYVLKRKGKFHVDKEGQEITTSDALLTVVDVKTHFDINEVDGALILTSDIKFIAHAQKFFLG